MMYTDDDKEYKENYYKNLDEYNSNLYQLSIVQLKSVILMQRELNRTLEKLTSKDFPRYMKYIDQLQRNIKSLQDNANKNFLISTSLDTVLDSIPDIDYGSSNGES